MLGACWTLVRRGRLKASGKPKAWGKPPEGKREADSGKLLPPGAGAFSPRGFFPTGLFPHGVFSPRGFFPTGLFPTGLFPTGLFPTGLFPHGAFPPRGFSPTVVSWHAACMATPLGIPGGEIAPDARGSPENRANHSRYDRTRSVPIGRYRRFYGLVFWGVSPLKIALARGLLVVQIPCQRRGFFLHFFSL